MFLHPNGGFWHAFSYGIFSFKKFPSFWITVQLLIFQFLQYQRSWNSIMNQFICRQAGTLIVRSSFGTICMRKFSALPNTSDNAQCSSIASRGQRPSITMRQYRHLLSGALFRRQYGISSMFPNTTIRLNVDCEHLFDVRNTVETQK